MYTITHIHTFHSIINMNAQYNYCILNARTGDEGIHTDFVPSLVNETLNEINMLF